MNKSALRQWLGPLLVLLFGLIAAGLARANWIPNYVFKGTFTLDLSILLLLAGLLTGLVWMTIALARTSTRKRVDRAKREEKADQAGERQRFLRRLDHELKNPLTTIRLGIANLQGSSLTDEEVNASLERISLQAQRLQILVQNLRRLSEMDENSLDRSEVNLGEVLEEAKELACAAPECQGGAVNLSIQQLPWQLSPINGDRDLLLVVFRNLIENALKFSGEGGRVEVRAAEDGHNVVVEIDDNGRGIPSADQPYIFDELYRAENARDVAGSGMGLSLARRIIELHGGSLLVNSRLDQGTMVRIQLPIHSL